MSSAIRSKHSPGHDTEPPPVSGGVYKTVATKLIWVWVASITLLFLWVVVASLKDSTDIFSPARAFRLPTSLQWGNYGAAWVNSDVGHAFLNTVAVVGIASLLTVAISAPAAYALSRFQTRLSSPLIGLFAIGMGIPMQATIIPVLVVFQRLGLANSLTGLGIMYVAVQTPFTVFLLTGFFRSLPFELEEAAAMDGASVIRTFREIMLPLAQSGLITALSLNIVFLWNETALVLFLVQDDAKFTLGRSLLNLSTIATYTSTWGALFAGCVIVVVPILLTYALLGRRIVEGMTLGAAK
ncbi:MAG: carbohydrate ABC transporter permease [Nocardioidaceae bacterium]